MAAHVRSLGREVIGWHEGLEDPADKKRITQLWARATPLPENPFIDSRSTYLNHMDRFDAVSCLFFQQSCRSAHGDAKARGGILCSWPDIRIENERDQLRQNPIYPGHAHLRRVALARRGHRRQGSVLGQPASRPARRSSPGFREFEARLLEHQARFFAEQGIPLRQTNRPALENHRAVSPRRRGDPQIPGRGRAGGGLSGGSTGTTVGWTGNSPRPRCISSTFSASARRSRRRQGTCYALTHIWSPDSRAGAGVDRLSHVVGLGPPRRPESRPRRVACQTTVGARQRPIHRAAALAAPLAASGQ